MASARPEESKTRHRLLGPGVAIGDDRSRTRLRVLFDLFLVPVGILGMFLGSGDLAGGNAVLGVAQAAGGVIVALYGVRAAVVDGQRLVFSTRLVIARDGFELLPGPRPIPWLELFPSRHPISWNEVESIGDPRAPAGQPRTLRVQLNNSEGFASREGLSVFARIMLRFNRGDLVLGSGMAVPIVRLETVMRKHLDEFRGSTPDSAGAHERAREPKRRRPRKR